MAKQFLLIVGFLFSIQVMSQTGIGTTTPNASAKLDVFSDNKGFLPPRVSLSSVTDQSTIPSPAVGLLVYCKGDAGLSAGYYYWNGNAWATIATAGGSGSFAASFLRGSRTAVQSSIAVGGIVSFSAVDNTSGQDISLNTSNGKITLAPGNTYRLIAAVPNFTGSRPAFMWYNETSSSYIGSATNGYFPTDGASGAGAFGGIAEVIITPSVSTVLSFRLLSSLSSGTITVGGLADFSTTGSYPWFEAQVISGNTPVTGQSVEYGIAKYTGADGTSLSANAIVAFDATATGNLGWSGSKFTLKANKTYELESYLAVYHASAGVAGVFQIYNYTNSTALANGLYLSMNGSGGYNVNANGPMRCIITPTTDIEVGVRITSAYGGWPSIVGSTSTIGTNGAANQSYLLVKQIGSSAIINPWTLSGMNTYNTTGNVGIGTSTPVYTLDVSGTAKLSTTPTITTASNVLVKDPTTSQISEQPISFITGVSKFIRNTNQGTLSSGTTVIFNSTSNNTISSYVTLNTSTGVITLQPGTYELNGSVGALGGSSGSNGDSRIYPVFHNGITYVGTGGVSETGPAGNWNGMPQNNANYIITVPIGQTAQLTLKAAIVNNVSTLSETGDYGAIGDAGRAWVVVRKYN